MTNQLTNPSRTECPPMPLSFIPPEMYSISFEQYRPKLSQYNIIQPYHMTTPTPSPMATTESSHLADEHQEQHQQLPLEMDLLQHPLQKSVSSNAIPIQPGKLKQRKRKRKNTIEKNPSIADIQTANHHAIIGPFLIHSLKTLKSSPNYPFPIIIPHDSNIVLSESNDDDIDFVKFGELASIAEKFADSSDIIDSFPSTDLHDLIPSPPILSLFSTFISNNDSKSVKFDILSHSFIIPPYSSFIMAPILSLSPSQFSPSKFDFIVIDPPWPNKSVSRSQSYHSFDPYDLFQIPLSHWLNDSGIVLVWVTNKRKWSNLLTKKLGVFEKWNCSVIGEWYWLKVTTNGDWVVDIDSVHRKPYEPLIIGQKQSQPGNSRMESLNIPSQHAFASIPSLYHSRKPNLLNLFSPYLPHNPKCLELFARNVNPGWTCTGNEVLKFNDLKYFTVNPSS